MEGDTCEQELIIGTEEEIEHEEEIVETEIEPQEVEIETEDQTSRSPEIILPDVKKPVTVPPLRPLTIAPKPKQIPIAVKPMAGQQLLLLQGGTAGQTIKLVSPQGQELSLANYAISRPLTIKPTVKTISTQGGNISLVQQKPVVMKKIVTTGQKTITKPVTLSKPITFAKPGQQFMVIQKPDQQQVKLMQSPTKTITLQQAQEMGLLTNAKFLPQTQAAINKQTVLINKNQQKTIKIVPQLSPAQVLTTGTTKTITVNQLKQPTKILPATSMGAAKPAQRIIFKNASGAQTILPGGHLIQMTGNQALQTGNIHQINIPGKGMQYIKFVSASSAQSSAGLVTITNAVKTTLANPSGVLAEAKPSVSATGKIAPKPISIKPAIQVSKVAIPQIKHAAVPQTNVPKATSTTPGTLGASEGGVSPPAPAGAANDTADPNGIRPRKPCNCTKSQCLKLYCDCFANGEFCFMCNCMNCFNNLENEEHRNRAIKACLERNPNAFRPKIGKAKDTTGDVLRKHTKGCNCKRSGCLKNYCECYEAKIACSNNCKCIGCRNIEDSMDKRSARVPNILEKSNSASLPERVYRRILPHRQDATNRLRKTPNLRKQTLNFITDDVIEATCQCLLTISEDADSIMQDEEVTKKQIIEEFGRCLTEIINCSTNRCLS
ncbi:protein lin-54 homolog isoform X2 [Cylas formicarius]|uniref:protein lin-54 homolog isoform X2 n=1 Tax=Cylas formicarius TaxID=197179 RepID=UPI002958D8C3|nr:protein lin-54 homolog isoform X2 [Cylas formicarius]